MHRPISLKDISLSYSHKNCFEDFSAQIYPGSRIAIIGRNGSGKSSLLKILQQTIEPSYGEVIIPDEVTVSCVEQTISGLERFSGGQRFNKRLSEALAHSPDLLLLDEPTNHLDQDNRKSLMQMLRHFHGTLVIVSHDKELLRNCIDTLWHIDQHKIHEFCGSYDDYMREAYQKQAAIEKELVSLKRQKKDNHAALMKEQQRAAKSKAKGKKSLKQNKWSPVVGKAKAMGAETHAGKKRAFIDQQAQTLTEKLSGLRLADVILPTFSLSAENISSGHILSIHHADIGYNEGHSILKNINLSITGKERISIAGKNASGKSTLLKAILGHKDVMKTGDWRLPNMDSVGYLDQHYSNLTSDLSIMEHIKQARSDWSDAEIRRHLNDFLFRKNEEVNQLAGNLSGGEKARLSLSLIAAQTPKLLILDEMTNNLDIETKDHVVQVLKAYPGAMIIISHEEEFLEEIGVETTYQIDRGNLLILS